MEDHGASPARTATFKGWPCGASPCGDAHCFRGSWVVRFLEIGTVCFEIFEVWFSFGQVTKLQENKHKVWPERDQHRAAVFLLKLWPFRSLEDHLAHFDLEMIQNCFGWNRLWGKVNCVLQEESLRDVERRPVLRGWPFYGHKSWGEFMLTLQTQHWNVC